MVTVQTTGVVQVDGTVILTLPAEVPPGEHTMVVVVETKSATKEKRGRTSSRAMGVEPARVVAKDHLRLPIHTAVPQDPDMTFSREEMYGEWGR